MLYVKLNFFCVKLQCDDWYHWSCVGITREPKKDSNWYCKNCKFFMESANGEKSAVKSSKIPPTTTTATTPQQKQKSVGGSGGPLRSKKNPKNSSSSKSKFETSKNDDNDDIMEEKSPAVDKNNQSQIHKCETCDEVFGLKSSLMDHCTANNHRAAIPYEEPSTIIRSNSQQKKKKMTKKCNCALCDFKCYNVIILKQHYLSAHSDDLTGLENVFKHIKCPMCEEKFCTKNGLFYHYKTEHSAILAKNNKEKKEIQKAEMWIKKEKFENES